MLSTAAWQGQAGNIGYCTAKSGLINFTRSAAMELAPYGIRVNSFTPTATMPDDPQLAAGFTSAAEQMAATGVMDFAGQNPWPACRHRRTTWHRWCSSPPTTRR